MPIDFGPCPDMQPVVKIIDKTWIYQYPPAAMFEPHKDMIKFLYGRTLEQLVEHRGLTAKEALQLLRTNEFMPADHNIGAALLEDIRAFLITQQAEKAAMATLESYPEVRVGQDVVGVTAIPYIKPEDMLHDCGVWFVDRGSFPTEVTISAKGSIRTVRKNDVWTVRGEGKFGGLDFPAGSVLIALDDIPNQDASKWGSILINVDSSVASIVSCRVDIPADQQRHQNYEVVTGHPYALAELRQVLIAETGEVLLQQRWGTPLLGNAVRKSWRDVPVFTKKTMKDRYDD